MKTNTQGRATKAPDKSRAPTTRRRHIKEHRITLRIDGETRQAISDAAADDFIKPTTWIQLQLIDALRKTGHLPEREKRRDESR